MTGRAGKALLPLLLIGAAPPSAETIRFIACPIYRDTDAGRKSGCWLADEQVSGRRFDISRAPTKPDWNHEVLVEGRVASSVASHCGGLVLEPVRASVMPGSCPRHMLPGEGFAGNKFALPVRNVRPVSEARPAPPKPWSDRTFSLVFDFDAAFLVYQLDDYLLDQAITYIRAVGPRKVIVTGWAATEPAIVSGQRIAETPGIARVRAERIAEALARLGVSREKLVVRWRTGAQPRDVDGADGLAESSRRRVDIDVRL